MRLLHGFPLQPKSLRLHFSLFRHRTRNDLLNKTVEGIRRRNERLGCTVFKAQSCCTQNSCHSPSKAYKIRTHLKHCRRY